MVDEQSLLGTIQILYDEHRRVHHFLDKFDDCVSARIVAIAAEIANEAAWAAAKHKPMNSHHEAYAVIAEEFSEYWDEVCKGGSTPRDPKALRRELIQTAAMCVRALHDLC